MIYTITPGDTLSSIAENLTLDPSYWKAIAAYNGIADPNVIYAGTQITIPDNWLKAPQEADGVTGPDTSSTDTTQSLVYPARPGQSAPDAQAYVQQYSVQANTPSIFQKLKTTTIAGVPAIYFVYGAVAWWAYKKFLK